MAIKDILLPLRSYPDPSPSAAIEQAVEVAAMLGAHVSALTFSIDMPRAGSSLANVLLDLPGMAAAERRKSEDNARALMETFGRLAAKRGLTHRQIVESCATSELAAAVTEQAKVYDLTMIPIGERAGLQQYVAEHVLFGSGRPAIIYPEVAVGGRLPLFDVVGIAWDFGRPAARAVADALPFLKQAGSVHVVTITDETTIETSRSGAELVRHLACHGVEAVLEEQPADGRPVGEALAAYATARRLGLLVMGAYGHSRARDFILGGATRSIVAAPPLPVLLSH
jgi:nucleotide-binding universal stress UspA family protein